MKQFSLLIKPASADCNMRCDYCFYLEKAALYPGTSRHVMPDRVLERLISSYMDTGQAQYQFGWQGGEPTLLGNRFFSRVVTLQKRYGRPGSVAANGLQTNATLIDEDLAATLAGYNFLVGVSLDGPPDIHDRFRKYPGGKGSHADVLKGIATLRKHGVEFNALTLINSGNAGRGPEVYRYMRDLGIYYHQYIPCVEFDGGGGLLPFSITGEKWGDFLTEVFEQWIKTDTRTVSVRLFDSILNLLVLGRRTVCHMADNCCQYLLVEHNGDVYPCDFFVLPERKLGNIMEDEWEDLLNSPLYRDFGSRKSMLSEKCKSCEFLSLCAGDCMKHRPGAEAEPEKLSVLCRGWKKFYERTIPEFKKLAEEIRSRSRHEKPGRNDLCSCGSGKKYKRCHGA